MGIPSFVRATTRALSSREDRLTELVALVFTIAPDFAEAFAAAISDRADANSTDEPGPGNSSWSIETQLPVDTGTTTRFVDLSMASESQLIWVEAKLDASLSRNQLEDYYGALAVKCRDKGATGTLVFLPREGLEEVPVNAVRRSADYDPTHTQVVGFNWKRFEGVINSAEATNNTARRLGEALTTYLKETKAVVPLLAPTQIEVLTEYQEAKDSLWHFLENIAGQIDTRFRKENHKSPANPEAWRRFPRYEMNYKLTDDDPEQLGLLLEWNFDVRDDGWPDGAAPAFGWGFTLNRPGASWPDAEFVSDIEARGFAQLPDGDYPRLFKSRSLHASLQAGQSLDSRVDGIVDQILDDFAMLEQCRP